MKLNSSADSGKQRERFASPLVIALVVGTGLAMLVALFPEKDIVNMLGRAEKPSPAVMRYLEALIMIRPDDVMLRMELARIYIQIECPGKALDITVVVKLESLSPEQRLKMENIRYQAALQRLYMSDPDDPSWNKAQTEYASMVEKRIKEGASRPVLGAMLADADMAGDRATVHRLLSITGPAGPTGMKSGDAEADGVAGRLLAAGDYRGAADAYISFLRARKDLHDKRRLYIAAISALQSGNMLSEALKLAENHIDELGRDRESLVFVTRLALAANRPEIAQKYVRRALGASIGSGG